MWYNEGNALGTRFAERLHAESVRQIDAWSSRRTPQSAIEFHSRPAPLNPIAIRREIEPNQPLAPSSPRFPSRSRSVLQLL